MRNAAQALATRVVVLLCAVATHTLTRAQDECGRLFGGLSVDGSLADAVWKGRPHLGPFRIDADGTVADVQTEVRTCHDEHTLYVICTCREPDVGAIRSPTRERDADLSQDDCVEIHLRTPNGSRAVVAISPRGTLRDELDGDVSWSAEARTGTRTFKHAWGAEVALPIGIASTEASQGGSFALNVVRRRKQAGDVSRLRPEGEYMTVKMAPPPRWLTPIADVRPRAGIRYSAQDIHSARENAQRFDWARATVARIVSTADQHLARPASYYLAFLPPEGATFAYGFAGCPKCNGRWPRFGSGMCSFDKPGKVTCRHCSAVLPDDSPGSPHHDAGHGVEIGGDMYYFTGVWNAWVILRYKTMLGDLSHAYALTGDERYAERAALIFDAMATLAPSTVGPRDNMRPHQKVAGRFHYYTQQWTEHLRGYLLDYDLLYHSEHMAAPSPTAPTGVSIRRNVEKNLFLDTWDVEMDTRNGRLPSLHNHTSATVRAMMGVGLVCGEPDLIRWGIEAAYKFITNTADPEGQYYETSGHGYNECGRRCNGSFADMLWNYDPQNYDNPPRFPQPSDYPHATKLYRHPRMKLHLDRVLYDMDCAGHIPRYGDAGADTGIVTDPVGQWAAYRLKWAFSLYRTAATEPERLHFYRKMQAAAKGRPETALGTDGLFWFRPMETSPPYDPELTFSPAESSLWGQRATAILRQGKGHQRMALLMLGGTIFPHGNDDTLHIAFYSQGQMLTHDVAYDLYGRPIHYGWATRSIAHTTVTVDERGGPPLHRGGPNATVTGFADTALVSFVAMATGPQCWTSQPAVRRYDRACALVRLPEGGYVIDLFNVEGGTQHDYSFHGQVTNKGEGFTFEGVSPEAVEGVWTLAGLSGHADASFDAPGHSWGERCLPGNRIRKLNTPGEKVGYFGWWPPPGNGYGFLYDAKTAPASDTITADWTTHPERDIHLRLSLFAGADAVAITAKAPDLTGRSVIPYVIARTQGQDLNSSFLAAIEGYTGAPRVNRVTPLEPIHGMRGLEVQTDTGAVDTLWLDTDGRLAFARRQGGKVTAVALSHTVTAGWGDTGLELVAPSLTGTVRSVDVDAHQFSTDIAIGNPEALRGKRLFLSNANDYNHNSTYAIEQCDSDGAFAFGLVGFELAFADFSRVRGDGAAVSSTPMPLVWTGGAPRATGLLDGKLARTPDGLREAVVDTFVGPREFRFRPGGTIREGDRFTVLDVKQGDTVSIPMHAEMERNKDGTWDLTATCDVIVRLPAGTCSYRTRDGRWAQAKRQGTGLLVPVGTTDAGKTVLRPGK